MLRLPPNGFIQSVNIHRSDLQIVSDWIEASLLFSEDSFISTSDIVDILIEENIYSSQDFAKEFIEDCWSEIIRRQSYLRSNKIIDKVSSRLTKYKSWDDLPAYSFCLLSCIRSYYRYKIGGDFYNKQGLLFEKITECSLNKLFPSWNILQTGYSAVNKTKFNESLKFIADQMNVSISNNASDYYSSYARDAKLDLILFKRLNDVYPNIPIYLIQCASGENWTSKRYEPDLDQWKLLLFFNSTLAKGLAMPYCLSESEHKLNFPLVKGIFFDRMRILSAYSISNDWIPTQLSTQINRHNSKIVDRLEFY